MELDGLSLFIDTVRAGSITGAARKRGIPKSTASRQLRQFEDGLGVRLLERSTRRLDLTEAGRMLYDGAAPYLDELEDIQASVGAFQRHPKGRLTIELPQELFTAQMGDLVGEYLQGYPDVHLVCTQYGGTAVMPTGPADFDLRFVLHDEPLPASDWIARPLLSIPQGLFAAPALADSVPAFAQDLIRCPCILRSGETSWSFRVNGRLQAVPVQGRIVLNSPDMQLHAAIRGLGIARLACFQAEAAVRRGSLVQITVNAQPVAQQLTVLYRSRQLPLKTRLFLDHFLAHIGRLQSLL